MKKLFEKTHLLKAYFSTVGAVLFFCLAIWYSAPFLPPSKTIRQFFLEENNIIEVLALCFLTLAILLAVFTLVRTHVIGKHSRWWWLFPISIFLLVCDETSFGRVYFKWYTPPRICNSKFDALHDMLAIFPHCLPYLGISRELFFLSIACITMGILLCAVYLGWKYKSVLLTSFKTKPVWVYLFFAFIFFWVGGGLELFTELDFVNTKENGFLVFLEEVFELLAELTVLFAAFSFFSGKE